MKEGGDLRLVCVRVRACVRLLTGEKQVNLGTNRLDGWKTVYL